MAACRGPAAAWQGALGKHLGTTVTRGQFRGASTARALPIACTIGCRACRQLLGIGPRAGKLEVREAFLAAAWRHHPDSSGGQRTGADFARLRQCYELLSSCLCTAHTATDSTVPPNPAGPSWDEAAQDISGMNGESQESHGHRRRSGGGRLRKPEADGWATRRFAGAAATLASQGVPDALEVEILPPASSKRAKPLPRFLWASAAAADPTGAHGREDFCGAYRRTKDFNATPAYVHTGLGFYLFWSQLFNDWKIAQRLKEGGVCAAFFDGSRESPPWRPSLSKTVHASGDAPMCWAVWDPTEQRFSPRTMSVRPPEPD
ncbi:unnamed protein product [Polarella glacialis]|uniref:J domain-containing protein n=1 Tax=Polarella glacialis TaxID=89957 RepID=A0A813K6U7_POLGL|nr:unnamed protein product [Polarella glacialis]